MLIRAVFFISFLMSSSFANADEHTKVLFHFNDAFKLKHLEKSVNNIRNEMGKDVEITVVVNGKAVQVMLKNNRGSSEILSSILQKNVKVGLCHNAINSNRVSKDMLIEGLNVLPQDGNVTIINLQKKGYLYIKI